MKPVVLALLASLLTPAAQSQIIPTGSLMTIINGGAGTLSPPPLSVPLGGAGNIRFAKLDPIKITLRPDQTASTFVDVISDDDKPAASLQFYLNLTRTSDSEPCKGTVVTLPAALGLQKNTSRSIPIEITGCGGGGATGFLRVLGSSSPGKEIPIALERASSGWLTFALYLSVALAIVIAGYTGVIVTRHGHRLTDAIGGASWDFGSSWASNITVFGTGFSFLIQLTIFPDKPAFGSRTEYAFLAAFATALVGFAPAVQRMMGQTDIDNSSGVPVATNHGLVVGFLTASAFTMWGAYLQIAVAILIICELGKAATLNMPIAVVVGLCVLLAGVGLMVYCWRTILTTIAANASRTGEVKGALKTFSAAPVQPAVAMARQISVL
jgi:hypothetical protein